MAKNRFFRFLKWFFGIILGLVILITLVLFIYKDDICGLVIKEVNKNLKAKVTVADVDLAFWGSFPNLSIDFKEVFIQDTYEESTKLDTLLYSDRIRFKLNPLDIWRENYTIKSVEVSPGVLKLKVNNSGQNNFDILKEKKDTLDKSQFDVNLKAVDLNEFRFVYSNKSTNQEYKTLIHSMALQGEFNSSRFVASAISNLNIISARSGNVRLLSNKPASLNISVDVDTEKGTVQIPLSTIFVAGLPFSFEGNVTKEDFNFNLKGKNIKIEDAANNMARKETSELRKFSGRGTFLFDLKIEGKNNATSPVSVVCDFGVLNATLLDPVSGIQLNQLKLDGEYSNVGGKKKEHLNLKNISFHTKGGPFKGNVFLTNFSDPVFDGNADGSIDLAVLHSLFQIPNIEKLSGTLDIHSDFLIQGRTTPKQTMEYDIMKCEGNALLNNINVQLVDDKRIFNSISGQVYLRNDEAGIERIALKIGDSDFEVSGVFKNVVPYFSDKGNLTANVDISSRRIVLEDLGSDSKEDKISKDRRFILPDNIDGAVYLKVGELTYDQHTFEHIKGNMIVGRRRVDFPQIVVRSGGADVTGSLSIEEKTPEIFTIESQMVSGNINFTSLFEEWNDFKQTVVTSKNIQGKAQANVVFKAPFDLRSGIISNAIVAQIDLQIDDGRLKNVETFKEIIKSLKGSPLKVILGKENIDEFGNKLQDLKFDQLKNSLIIKDGILTIPMMTIRSSALNVEASGTHTFNNHVDYKFGFNFRDLRRKKESEFGKVIDDGTGIQIFMRMYGDLDSPTIVWDKESRKISTQEYNKQEKENLKAMFKSELGLYKNDTTVKKFVKENNSREELIIEFDPVNSIDTIIEMKKPKRDTKISKTLKKWKEQSEGEKKEEFVIDE